jgi:hypothetical protein
MIGGFSVFRPRRVRTVLGKQGRILELLLWELENNLKLRPSRLINRSLKDNISRTFRKSFLDPTS